MPIRMSEGQGNGKSDQCECGATKTDRISRTREIRVALTMGVWIELHHVKKLLSIAETTEGGVNGQTDHSDKCNERKNERNLVST